MNKLVVFLLFFAVVPAESFAPTSYPGHADKLSSSRSRSSTQLAFGIPKFLTPQSNEDDKDTKKINNKGKDGGGIKDEKKIGLSSVLQLITAGAGAPFLGDYEGVDKDTGRFMFSLEANNLVDEDGNSKQTKMPYFENGWVDPEDQAKADNRKAKGFKFPWDN